MHAKSFYANNISLMRYDLSIIASSIAPRSDIDIICFRDNQGYHCLYLL